MPPSVTPYAPQTPQSQMLAQVLQQMRDQQNTTPIGGAANMVATAMLNAHQQAAGQGGAGQWLDNNGNPSGNWFNSRLGRALTGQPQAPGQQPYVFGGSVGKAVGGLFGLGQAAQTQQGLNTASQQIAANGVMPAGL